MLTMYFPPQLHKSADWVLAASWRVISMLKRGSSLTSPVSLFRLTLLTLPWCSVLWPLAFPWCTSPAVRPDWGRLPVLDLLPT